MKHEDLVKDLEAAVSGPGLPLQRKFFAAKAAVLDAYLAERDYAGLAEVNERLNKVIGNGIPYSNRTTSELVLDGLEQELTAVETELLAPQTSRQNTPVCEQVTYVKTLAKYAPQIRADYTAMKSK